MSFIQALLIGMVYWINTLSFGHDLYWSFIQVPLAAGFWAGLILGDVKTGVICGALIQPLYLAHTQAGGTVPSDKCAGTLIATSLVIAGGLDVSNAVVLAIPIGLVTAQLHTLRRIVMGFVAQRAEAAASKGDTAGFYTASVLLPILIKALIFWVPMTAMLFLGTDFITGIINGMPPALQSGFSVVGGLLPAIGFGVMIYAIGRKDLMIYFAVGFFLYKYTGIGTMFLVMISIFLAYIHMRTEKSDGEDVGESIIDILKKNKEAAAETNGSLSNKDLLKVFARWFWYIESCNSFERLQGPSVGLALQPTLKNFYQDKPEEYAEALTRHTMFFNTECNWGAPIIGIVTAMEEQRAKGMPIEPEAIIGIKTGLMGPLAGIGDTIDWATINPLLIAAFIPAAANGKWWAFVAAGLLTFVIVNSIGIVNLIMGYRMGAKAAVTLLQSGRIKKVMTLFGVIGLFMMGTLAAQYVNVNIGLNWAGNEGASVNIQAILDSIIPGLLTILTVFGVYRYQSSEKGSTMKATLWLTLIGLICGCLGILV